MRLPVEFEKKQEEQEIKAYAVNHLPIVKEFAAKLGIVEVINTLVPSRMHVEPGVIFLGMILDTLSGRTPLYRLEDFFSHQDMELLLERDIDPDDFADHNVGRVLDKAYEAGSIKIFSEIARRGVNIFNIDTRHVSFDTTSVSVFGNYDNCSGEDTPLKITFGHSKDHRPDLKQFLVSMLCVDGNVPVFGKTEDGNASDKTINNKVLTSVSKHMAKHGLEPGAFIYIADSAMVTPGNLKAIKDNEVLFISRFPATYNECGRVIKEAVNEDKWDDTGVLAITEPTKNRPAAHYKVCEKEVEVDGEIYRAIVVHSSAHDKRRQKRIDKELKGEYKSLKSGCKKVAKEEFFCCDDAQRAANQLQKTKSKYYAINTEVKEVPKYKKGRPKNGIKEISEMHYRVSYEIEEIEESVEKFKKEAGCFVLISNVPKEGEDSYTPYLILKAYKDQYGIEQNFGFLKDPAIVNGIFLEKPERIEILGLILLLSLLIWRLIEHSLRQHVKNTGDDLPGWERRRTERPTTFMMVAKFSGVMIIKIGKKRILNKHLTQEQKEYLVALGLSEKIFTIPRRI